MVGELTFWTKIHDYVMRKLSPSNTSGPWRHCNLLFLLRQKKYKVKRITTEEPNIIDETSIILLWKVKKTKSSADGMNKKFHSQVDQCRRPKHKRWHLHPAVESEDKRRDLRGCLKVTTCSHRSVLWWGEKFSASGTSVTSIWARCNIQANQLTGQTPLLFINKKQEKKNID